ncbi:hypothetical protein NSND_50949 [Nitrospira sp. ND1]|nr:hypothetical protein NSND_50949 [Nitrospira sp. ND1]
MCRIWLNRLPVLRVSYIHQMSKIGACRSLQGSYHSNCLYNLANAFTIHEHEVRNTEGLSSFLGMNAVGGRGQYRSK